MLDRAPLAPPPLDSSLGTTPFGTKGGGAPWPTSARPSRFALGFGGQGTRYGVRLSLSPDQPPAGDPPDDETPGKPNRRRTTSVARIIDSEYGGNAERALAEALEKRDSERELRVKYQKRAGVIESGGVILSPDERKTWDAFKELGKAPADIATALGKAAEDAKTVAEIAERKTYADAAKDAGYNEGVVKAAAKLLGGTVETKTVEVTVDGKTVKQSSVYLVKTDADGKQTREAFEAAVQRDEPDLFAMLKTKATATGAPAASTPTDGTWNNNQTVTNTPAVTPALVDAAMAASMKSFRVPGKKPAA